MAKDLTINGRWEKYAKNAEQEPKGDYKKSNSKKWLAKSLNQTGKPEPSINNPKRFVGDYLTGL